jgi:hypothetical protein
MSDPLNDIFVNKSDILLKFWIIVLKQMDWPKKGTKN